ncbi:claudin-4-like [Megalobrama amblycephala]|uniref:claudin-4-like n=1 Tax=Megalobrama amblycephala TaxID=75352 RepID=UPI002013C408|nr:claudin-4-like [Megalobrama amblycephala]
MDIKIEFASFGLASAGWFCTILTRFLPMWKVGGRVENTTTTLPLYWDGVWLNWQHHTTGRLHCTFYQSLLFLTEHFNTWKILIITSIGMGVIAMAVYAIGWIHYPRNIWFKAASGPSFVVSGLPLLVVVSWTTHLTDSNANVLLTREWGAAIFTGWLGVVLLEVGGGVLSIICCRAVQKQRQDGSPAQTSEPGVQVPLHTIHSTTFIQSPLTG